jgi:hypothetical protein
MMNANACSVRPQPVLNEGFEVAAVAFQKATATIYKVIRFALISVGADQFLYAI